MGITKPPYRVPSMAEIAALPWNGFNAVSTFSGCGGSCLGYRMAGFRVLWASEFVPAAQETYRANHPETFLDTRDIRDVSADDILDAIHMYPGELDLFDGSPPCASFSLAGKREEHWGKVKKYSDVKQRTDDLFFEYARLIAGVQPKVFVAENVKGLTVGVAKSVLGSPQLDLFDDQSDTIFHTLCNAGYRVAFQILNARHYGVPQSRARCIFVGVRRDLGLEPVFPPRLPYEYSVRDALPWLVPTTETTDATKTYRADEGGARRLVIAPEAPAPTVMAGGIGSVNCSQYRVDAAAEAVRITGRTGPNFTRVESELDHPMNTIPASDDQHRFEIETYPAKFAKVEDDADISRFAIGAEWDKLRPGEQSERYFSLIKPALDAPCPTVTQTTGNPSAAGVVHPTEKRKFSIAELRRICAFPDDFVLTGTYSQQWERLGRAVPPVMMSYIAATVRDEILRRATV